MAEQTAASETTITEMSNAGQGSGAGPKGILKTGTGTSSQKPKGKPKMSNKEKKERMVSPYLEFVGVLIVF